VFCWGILVVFKNDVFEIISWQDLTLVGGDFNLVRNQQEKSNGAINFHHVNTFNDSINK
jgi:hypothetical protein